MSRFFILTALACLLATALSPRTVDSKRPLLPQKLSRGVLATSANLMLKRMQQTRGQLKQKLSEFVDIAAARPMRVFFCPLLGYDLQGNTFGEENGSGFIFLYLFKRSDGDYNLRFLGFAKLSEPEVPTVTINVGGAGEDGSAVLDFSDATWYNVTRPQELNAGFLSYFPDGPYPLGYNYLFMGLWTKLSEMSSDDGASYKDTMDNMRDTPNGHYGVASNSVDSTAIRGQCGIDRSPFN